MHTCVSMILNYSICCTALFFYPELLLQDLRSRNDVQHHVEHLTYECYLILVPVRIVDPGSRLLEHPNRPPSGFKWIPEIHEYFSHNKKTTYTYIVYILPTLTRVVH